MELGSILGQCQRFGRLKYLRYDLKIRFTFVTSTSHFTYEGANQFVQTGFLIDLYQFSSLQREETSSTKNINLKLLDD